VVTIRIQAAVQSGRAILRLRNAMEQPVVVTRVVLAPPEAEEHAAVAPVEVKLNPGEIQAVDITEPVLKIIKPISMLDEQRKRLRIRLFLDPHPPDHPPVADCTLTVARGEIIEFHC
jgi:hypothetical protein